MRILPLFLFIFCALFKYVHPSPSLNEKCRPFVCGKLGEIWFPYTNNATQGGECGPFVVKGCSEDHPEVQFERKRGKWYQVENISQAGVITITDKDFQSQLAANPCESILNFSIPELPPPFRLMTDNLTLFKCPTSVNAGYPFCHNFADCPNFNLSYSLPDNHSPSNLSGCANIQLPKIKGNNSGCIFQLLTATFSLNVFVDPKCFDCYFRGNCARNLSECPKDFPTSGKTATADSKALGRKIGLGAGIPAVIVIIVLIWSLYKRKHAPLALSYSSSTPRNGSNSFTLPIFSYDELQKATKNFDTQGELGDGGFGTVYHGRLRDGREVAVKRLHERNYKKVTQYVNEIEILTRLRHPNLVSLYGCTSPLSRELLLVYEYIPNGTVADHLRGDRAMPGRPSWPIRIRIAIETATALTYLHASEIVHRDVKTKNILLDMNFRVKVADFGISRLVPVDVTHISTAPQGTPGYVDPEYYQCYQLTDKSDVYSFGVVLVELVSSLPAVDLTRERHEVNLATLAMNKIQKCEFEELIDPNLDYNTDEEIERMITSVVELAFQCLQQDRELRPSMDEVLKELIMIEGKENELENSDEKSVEPLYTTQNCNEISLLKNTHPLPNSPNFTVDEWRSSYRTQSI